MALYSYKARDEAGKIITDAIESTSRSTAAALLKGQGLQVMTVKSVGGISSIFAGKVSVAEKAAFCRFMGTMLRSGMSLPEAVEIIRQKTKKCNRYWQTFLTRHKKGNQSAVFWKVTKMTLIPYF